MKKYKYDIKKYDFVGEIETLYKVNDLSEIHNQWSEAIKYDVLDDVSTDQLTVYHKHFYDNSKDSNWYFIYNSFIKEIIQPLIGEDILYQGIPTFRVHQPSNLAVAAFHRDKDYSHSEDEINFYLPLTKAWGNNTIWVESEEGKGDYSSIDTEVGEMWMWSGATLMHGNKINDTGKSRVSVDFRVIPTKKYKDSNRISVTNKTKMIIGEYWNEIK